MAETTTIDPREAAHFGELAAQWWDPKGSSAMLHRLNPVRLGYIRDAIDRQWAGIANTRRPLAGRRALDVGCGAGLLCEPLARLGAQVTGLDAAAENIEVARAHAKGQGLDIEYRHHGVEDYAGPPFDLVTSLEVVEHVTDPSAFVAALAGALADNGLMILSTPNRTTLSRLLLVEGAELTGRVPRGTHDWDKFLTPPELQAMLEAAGLRVRDITGIGFDPLKGLHLSESLALNYILTATHA